jgi:hypothetical protein
MLYPRAAEGFIMVWACILGYVAIGTSFYLYITRTAQVDPYAEEESGNGLNNAKPTLRIVAGGAQDGVDTKAA